MYQSDTEILFPFRVAPLLRELRGQRWQQLVDRACGSPEASLDQLAFSLLLIKLSGCLTCHANSFRAMRGCTICASQTVRRFRGRDRDLEAQFQRARHEVAYYLRSRRRVRWSRRPNSMGETR